MHVRDVQRAICERFGSSFVETEGSSIVGIALTTLNLKPLNALRHHQEAGTSGWFIWGGSELSDAPDFFSPMHAEHLKDRVPELIPFLGLAPGWRVLLAPGYEDIWYDSKLVDIAL